jgi:hypothetical protein
MASSAVAPLAVSVLLPAAVARTKCVNFDEKMTKTISAKKIGNSLVHDGKKRLSTIPQSVIAPLSPLAGLSSARLDQSMLPSQLVTSAAATAASSIGSSNPLKRGSRSSVGSASGSGSVGGCGGPIACLRIFFSLAVLLRISLGLAVLLLILFLGLVRLINVVFGLGLISFVFVALVLEVVEEIVHLIDKRLELILIPPPSSLSSSAPEP